MLKTDCGRRSWRWLLLAYACSAFALVVYFAIPPSRGLIRADRLATQVILDRNGAVLREVRSSEYGVSRWVSIDSVSPRFVEAVITAEDRRFYKHPGVDPLALARAALANVRAGRVTAGGSTITQQLVRAVYRIQRRTVLTKLGEALEAFRFELHLSKSEILEAYINRVWFGNQAYGIDAAAQMYFDCGPARLSTAQACLLAALPRQPGRYDLYRRLGRAQERQRWILDALLRQGRITGLEYTAALAESVVIARSRAKWCAPHFTDAVLAELSRAGERPLRVRTTLDRSLQQRCEELLENQLSRLSGNRVTNAAVVVLDRHTGDILAMVGSADYFASDAGQVNACFSLRQPGSTVKPFVYARAFEQGMSPAAIVPDLPGFFAEPAGFYAPRNSDREFHGPVSCRVALGSSYNVPAVRLAQELGSASLLETLRRCGMASLRAPPGYYGLALALGVGDVTLLELTNAYRVLANHGEYTPTRTVIETDQNGSRAPTRPGTTVISPAATYLVTHVLADNEARAPAFGLHSALCLPFPCAVKTGTSKDFRDNWTIGYTTDYVVGVWVGNFDGTPMRRVSGVTGAGPLFRDVMLAAHRSAPSGFTEPAGIAHVQVCPQSGKLPGRFCPNEVVELFLDKTVPKETCDVHRPGSNPGEIVEVYPSEYRAWMADRNAGLPAPIPESQTRTHRTANSNPQVLFPGDGDVFKLDPDLARDHQAILLRAAVPDEVEQAVWTVNGRTLAEVGPPFTLFWNLEPGRHRVRLQAHGRTSEEISFLVLP